MTEARPGRSPARALSGDLPAFRRDPLGFLSRCGAEGAAVLPLRFGRLRACLVNDPGCIEEVLVTRRAAFVKGRALRAHRRLLGEGLLTSEGAAWQRQRRIAQPAFRQSRLDAYGAIVLAEAERALATWREGEVRDVHADVQDLTARVAAACFFGAEIAEEAHRAGTAMHAFMDAYAARRGLQRLVPRWAPTPSNLGYERAVRQLEGIVSRILEDRRGQPDEAEPGDALSLLLGAGAVDGGAGRRELRDGVLTLFLGGFDTPALAIAWTFHLLSREPGAWARVVEEVAELTDGRALEPADRQRLRFTETAVLESMRLYPPAWLLSREAVGICEIGGHRLAAGTQVLISPWVTHRDARYFDAPHAFHPERWANGFAREAPRFAYLPFGGGPRVCIGAPFAMMEAVLLVARIARRFRLRPVPDRAIEPWPAMTLRFRGGLPLRLEGRA